MIVTPAPFRTDILVKYKEEGATLPQRDRTRFGLHLRIL